LQNPHCGLQTSGTTVRVTRDDATNTVVSPSRVHSGNYKLYDKKSDPSRNVIGL